MEYRIKMVQKNSGENLFYPQYRNEGWEIRLGWKIFFSWFVFLLWVCFKDSKKWNDIKEYFNMWHSIEYNKATFKEIHTLFCFNDLNAICDSKANAEQVIKVHKQDREDKIKKEQEEKHRAEMQKIKKVLYIKVK